MQFLVMAKDGSDEDALDRRKRTRPTHLASIGPLVDSGVELSSVYALAAIVAAAMGLLSFVVAGRGSRGQSVRPGAV